MKRASSWLLNAACKSCFRCRLRIGEVVRCGCFNAWTVVCSFCPVGSRSHFLFLATTWGGLWWEVLLHVVSLKMVHRRRCYDLQLCRGWRDTSVVADSVLCAWHIYLCWEVEDDEVATSHWLKCLVVDCHMAWSC